MDLFNDNFRENLASSLDYKPAPVDNNIRPPTGETWQQAGMTQYRGYYYEITNVTAGLGMGDNYTYALYPPEAADSAFFNYSSVMRVQGDFRTRGDANTAVRAWVDGLIGGSSDPSDTGEVQGIGIPGLLPGLPDALKPDDPPSTTPSELSLIHI